MPSRRIKSIMHGTAEDTRVYHREHRSKRGRDKASRRKEGNFWKNKHFREEREAFEKDRYSKKLVNLFNSDPSYRKMKAYKNNLNG